MKMQVRLLRMALWMMSEVTSESTPPDRPQMTLPVPTVRRISLTLRSMNEEIVQSARSPASPKRKLPRTFCPSLVDDLGVELDAEEFPGRVLDDGRQGVGRAAGDGEPRRRAFKPVAVAHPDLLFILDLGQKPRTVDDAQGGKAVFALLGRDDLAAERVGHELDAVANAQDRDAEVEDALGRVRRTLAVDALRPSGKDESGRLLLADRGERGREWQDLRVDTELADLPGDELGVLRPEIEDEDFLHGEILSERHRTYKRGNHLTRASKNNTILDGHRHPTGISGG
jgi:hypothetical protein